MIRRLLIMPNNPGDVLMALHAAAALKKQYPQDPLAFAVDSECALLVQNNPCVDTCLTIPRKTIRQNASLNEAARQLESFLDQCAEFAPTMVINLFQGEYGAILAGLIDAPQHLGPHYQSSLGRTIVSDPWSQYLLAIPVNRLANSLHVIDIFLRICSAVPSIPVPPPLPIVPPEDSKSLLQGLPQGPLIAFQPGSAWPSKQWPQSHWIELGKLLCQHTSADLLILGAPQESHLCTPIACALPPHRTHNFCGQTSLLSVRTLLEHCQILFCGDTFTMHLACALNVPVIALFGPSNPVETGPYQVGAQILRANPLEELEESLNFQDSKVLQTILPWQVFQVWQSKGVQNIPHYQSYWFQDHLQLYGAPNHPTLGQHPLEADVHRLHPQVISILHQQKQRLENPEDTLTYWQVLESTEQELAQNTRHSLSMEMYRMGMNALPAPTHPDHLKQRLQWVQQVLDLHYLKNQTTLHMHTASSQAR